VLGFHTQHAVSPIRLTCRELRFNQGMFLECTGNPGRIGILCSGLELMRGVGLQALSFSSPSPILSPTINDLIGVSDDLLFPRTLLEASGGGLPCEPPSLPPTSAREENHRPWERKDGEEEEEGRKREDDSENRPFRSVVDDAVMGCCYHS